ncbi:electron transport complex subunit RsxC [Pseudoalteromonas sp. SR43-6]|uniref:electron transport complex subunit RsxC n=1 Tax=unclassified Pseudoalteromonas TaxID=194690 RepID=UPI0015FCD8C9|nr:MULTISPECIES: electron transport complex subunit RsxC [unclassified Pseudoalteromonas]MBB1289277.1 electron transport complex subunit RsxC [Pseudoalteromonas sp. SR41-5]MBB1373525.1 electron transport complex subunit RsxC [Pseudoalteromonas sp. SR43-6]MBB1411986.1 electron transport complex subunit RsxC [Pseudoalteromonas sp. SG43-8]
MDKLLEQIKKGTVWAFPGGIHPPQQKSLSNSASITRLPLPDKLIVALKQHIGANGKLLVEKGQHVLKGQPLTEPAANWSVPVHAPSSGVVTDIAPMPSAHPSALPELSVIIEPDGKDEWVALNKNKNPAELSHDELINIIHQAGISGMGGAGFPTYVKADTKQPIEFLIVNAVECEPYITADDVLMREHAKEVIQGIEIMQQLLNPTLCIVGIEDNKPEAIAAMKQAAEHNSKIIIQTVPTIYPSGGEKQLIKLLTNREVPSIGIPADIGILVHNTGTLFAVQQAVYEGKPLIERIVTVTGNTIHKPGNVWALLGTEIKHLLDCQGFSPVPQQSVVMGGPMMGFTLPTVRIGIVKTTNCILAPDHKELAEPGPEKACIRCSACADACPASLLPQQLQWFAKSKEYDKLQEHNLFDCIECGACAYVCPSEIPLVQYYRIAKVEIKEQQADKIKADRAKERFDARKERLEREQEERQNRHKRKPAAKSADEKQKVAEALARVKNKSDNGDEKSAVAAAIARAKVKKQEGEELEPDNSEVAKERALRKEQARKYKEQKSQTDESAETAPVDDKKSAVAAAIARAKAKKAAQALDNAEQTTSEEPQTDAPVDDKKAAVAAAIARAKAKKAAKALEDAEQTVSEEPQSDTPADNKKSAVAAAIARAKAKKAAQALDNAEQTTSEVPQSDAPVDDKKAAVAAAIARAKAKKAAKALEDAEQTVSEEPQSDAPVDDKKATVAAAIARAKAKKAAKALEDAEQATSEEPQSDAPVDDKKAAVAAAIARAKAKKAAKALEDTEQTQLQVDSAAPKSAESNTDDSSDLINVDKPKSADDKKKAAVAAAIARAKAKKLQKEGNNQS